MGVEIVMEQILEIFGTIVGLVYLYLEYKASRLLWIASVIMPAVYLVVFYGAGLYADTAINIYYLVIALYGWVVWSRKRGDDLPTLKITRATPRVWGAMAVVYIIAQLLFSALLYYCTDSDVVLVNGATAALSVVGMWMLARKYVEQWLVWIVVDVASAALYFYKDLEPTAVLYLLYAVVAVFGYRKWKKLMKEEYVEA